MWPSGAQWPAGKAHATPYAPSSQLAYYAGPGYAYNAGPGHAYRAGPGYAYAQSEPSYGRQVPPRIPELHSSLCLRTVVGTALCGGLALLAAGAIFLWSGGSVASGADLQLLRLYLLNITQLSYECDMVTDEKGVAWCTSLFPKRAPCTVFSFSLYYDDAFELRAAESWGCVVHEFYPMVWGTAGWKANDTLIHWHKVGLANFSGSRPYGSPTAEVVAVDTLERSFQRWYKDYGWLAVRLDIGGEEWAALAAATDATLSRVDVLILRLNLVGDDPTLLAALPSFVNVLERLRSLFYLYHSRRRLCCKSSSFRRPFPGAAGFFIPGCAELFFVRKNLAHGNMAGPFRSHLEVDQALDETRSGFCTPRPLDETLFPIPGAGGGGRSTEPIPIQR